MTLLMHAIDLEGDSALQSRQPVDSALTAILLAYGADPTITLDGETAYDIAHRYNRSMAIRLLHRFTTHHGGVAAPDPGGLVDEDKR
ncbi:hypothetical protein [Streptomyces sp. WAC05374]|uniref:hypothetical protein n=1 Tax=Streptomyces sp. WAC05374 TaxID=2487420 RepID=UPI0028A6BF5F|nr:hypothetical protein [Streptomyces sp. WAC05374]